MNHTHYPPIAMHSCLGGKPEKNTQRPQRLLGVLLTGEEPAFSTTEIKFLKPGESPRALMTVNVAHSKCESVHVHVCFSPIATT